jgi:hypothetical protein
MPARTARVVSVSGAWAGTGRAGRPGGLLTAHRAMAGNAGGRDQNFWGTH